MIIETDYKTLIKVNKVIKKLIYKYKTLQKIRAQSIDSRKSNSFIRVELEFQKREQNSLKKKMKGSNQNAMNSTKKTKKLSKKIVKKTRNLWKKWVNLLRSRKTNLINNLR